MPVLHVPDMSCGHCRTSIEAALDAAVQGEALGFAADMEKREIRFEGLSADAAIVLLAEIGFEAEERV